MKPDPSREEKVLRRLPLEKRLWLNMVEARGKKRSQLEQPPAPWAVRDLINWRIWIAALVIGGVLWLLFR